MFAFRIPPPLPLQPIPFQPALQKGGVVGENMESDHWKKYGRA